MDVNAIPFFRAGAARTHEAGLPLGLMSGVLLFDSGEADHTFLFRCQDRYLVYNTLAGVRSIVFVSSEAHLQRYRELLDDLTARIRLVSAWTGLELAPVPDPLFVPLDPETLSVHDAPYLTPQLRQHGIRESLARGEIVFNQMSPTGARLTSELAAVLARHGVEWRLDERRLRTQGDLSLWCHDKTHYVDVVASSAAPLPAHARTAVVRVEELLALRDWDDLVALYTRRTCAPAPNALYVKSSFDSGGNVARRIARCGAAAALEALQRDVRCHVLWHPSGHGERLDALRSDVHLAPSMRALRVDEPGLTRYLRSQAERRHSVQLLVQEAIETDAECRPGCEGIGVTCALGAGRAEIPVVAGQLYQDSARHHFVGSVLEDRPPELGDDDEKREQVRALCGEFMRLGYEGPLNFDARRDDAGRWVFIYDCNPRLSAVYPALAVRGVVGARHRVDAVVSLGYRGEFASPDLEGALADLAAAGWLYSASRESGALPLPSIARDHGCDVALVNMSATDVNAFLLSPAAPARNRERQQVF